VDSCEQFCKSRGGRKCARAELTRGTCMPVRTWSCSRKIDFDKHVRANGLNLKCVCEDPSRSPDPAVQANPLIVPQLDGQGKCPSYQRVLLHLDVDDSMVKVTQRESFPEKPDDFNQIAHYDLCNGTELTPPESDNHCSMGNRPGDDPKMPCMYRLEQRTYDQASEACAHRGGRLYNPQSIADFERVRKHIDAGDSIGFGIRDFGAEQWVYDGDKSSAQSLAMKLLAMHDSDHKRITLTNCMRMGGSSRPALEALDCDAKVDYLCEGLQTNTGDALLLDCDGMPTNVSKKRTVEKDLRADEGAFCLWHVREPVSWLPNDEGTNFANTDLACSRQVSQGRNTACAYDPRTKKLILKRGNRSNFLNYPILGKEVGWTGPHANDVFLPGSAAYDSYHCHYSPTNAGVMRVYTIQHMYERNYAGSMKRCACGYKHMSNIVSRCDCTRSSRANNNCAVWHSRLLKQATPDTPVRCNNCNDNTNI